GKPAATKPEGASAETAPAPNNADENHAQPLPQTGGTTATQAGQVKPSGDSTPTGEPNKADDQGTQTKPTSNQGTTATTDETGNQKPSGQT
ncbi:hypothetical protein, partial [Klebsiella pneumoniae]